MRRFAVLLGLLAALMFLVYLLRGVTARESTIDGYAMMMNIALHLAPLEGGKSI